LFTAVGKKQSAREKSDSEALKEVKKLEAIIAQHEEVKKQRLIYIDASFLRLNLVFDLLLFLKISSSLTISEIATEEQQKGLQEKIADLEILLSSANTSNDELTKRNRGLEIEILGTFVPSLFCWLFVCLFFFLLNI
jgi:hypothetical protein